MRPILYQAVLAASVLFTLANSPFPGGCNSDVTRAHKAVPRQCDQLVNGQLPAGCTGVAALDGPSGSLGCSVDAPVDCGNGYCCGGKHATCCAEGHWCGTNEDACISIASSNPNQDDDDEDGAGSSSGTSSTKCGATTTCSSGASLQFCTAATDFSCTTWYQLGATRIDCGLCGDAAKLQDCSTRATAACSP